MGKGNRLGEFEEVVLLALASFEDSAYGVEVFDTLARITGREGSITGVYVALSRLEDKGYVKSYLGKATAQRGGRAKRFFTLQPAGAEVLKRSREAMNALWRGARLHPLLEDGS
ncbi:MAG: PadR family transcriptional regulator [Thermoanaerobaculia bacterium]|nr:PadR family transcriptional regulator [Thermoanaerobaculia bacterium]